MSELIDLITAVGILMALSSGGTVAATVAFVNWRVKRLEECLTGHKQKHDSDITRVHERIDSIKDREK